RKFRDIRPSRGARGATMARCTLLGTAAALPTAERDNTALVFAGRDSAILVDCPGGAYTKLLRAGIDPASMTHLLLTHQHTDHAPCAAVERLAHGAQLLIHEATFGATGGEDAARFAHSTAAQAGRLAQAAGVARLWLVHFSPHGAATLETQHAEAAAEFAGAV